jgi:hypothetical protein
LRTNVRIIFYFSHSPAALSIASTVDAAPDPGRARHRR